MNSQQDEPSVVVKWTPDPVWCCYCDRYAAEFNVGHRPVCRRHTAWAIARSLEESESGVRS